MRLFYSCRYLYFDSDCSTIGTLPRWISRLAAAAAFIFCALSSVPGSLAGEPSGIPNLQIWLKAGSAVPDDNGQLSVWPDSSGQGKNFIQSNEKYQPLLREDRLNGLPSVQFGKNQFLDSPAGALPGSDKITAFVVLRAGRDGGRTVLSSSYASGAKKDSDDMWGVFLSGRKIYSYARDSKGKADTVQHSIDKDKWVIHSTIWDSSNSFNAWIDGIAGKAEKGLDAKPAGHKRTRFGNLANCGLRNSDCGMMEKSGNGVSNGAGQALPASSGGYAGRAEHETLKNCGGGSQDAVEIAELIVYGKALSNSERLAVESYLHDKYFSDKTAPAISAVFAADESLKVVVSFSEEIDPDSVNPANFAITSRAVIPGRQNGGSSLSRPQMSEVPDNEMSGKNAQPTLSAVIRPDGRSVELTLSIALSGNILYTLSVSGIEDLAGNQIPDNSKADFDWTNISSEGLTLWLRADRNVVTAENASVTLWNDSSANSRNAISTNKNRKNVVFQSPDEGLVASRGDRATRPQGETFSLPVLAENSINGLPSIKLQGGKNGFTCGAIPDLETDKISWFAVFRTDNTDKYQFIIENAYASGARSQSKNLWGVFINDGQINTHSRTARGFLKNVKHPANSEWHIISGIWNEQDEVTARLDGENEKVRTGADALPEMHINFAAGAKDLKGSHPLNGELAEIIVYSREISVAEREQVENYLKEKYFEVNSVEILTDSGTIHISEGSSSTFGVKLSAQPTGDTTVSMSVSSGDADISIPAGSLVFTSSNWNILQNIAVSAAEDDMDTANGTAIINLSASGTPDKNVSANEIDDDFVLTVTAGGNGSTVPYGGVIVDKGNSPYSIVAVPNAYYSFEGWVLVSGSALFADANSAETTVTASADAAVMANFALITYEITASANSGGSIVPSGKITVNKGGVQSFTITPDSGYHIENVLVDGSSVGAVVSYEFTNVTANHTISVSFAIETYTVTFELGDKGIRSGGGELAQTVNNGSAAIAPEVTANEGWTFTGWDTAFDNVTGDIIVTAQYSVTTYTVTFIAGENGTLTGDNPQIVEHNGECTPVTAVPDAGFRFANWTGEVTEIANPITVSNVTSGMSITANFLSETLDSDLDGMMDWWEIQHGLNPADDSDAALDSDADGLSNLAEFQNGTDPANADSDADGLSDGAEVLTYLTNPNSTDSDGDGRSDYDEVCSGSDPNVLEVSIIVNENKMFVKSRNILLDPLVFVGTNYANIKISESPTMADPYLVTNPGDAFMWELPWTEEKTYTLYFQYVDGSGTPQGDVMMRQVVLDTTPPVLDITSPVGSGTYDQAFVSLELTAYDPNPIDHLVQDSGRNIKVFVDGELKENILENSLKIERFPVTGTGANSVTVAVEDEAGNVTEQAVNWTVDPLSDTIAPALSGINIIEDTDSGIGTGVTTVPDLPEIWVQGMLSDPKAKVRYSVNAGEFEEFNVVRNNAGNYQFCGLVPLEPGANTLAIEAYDIAGNVSSYSYALNRSTHKIEITSHNPESFANGAAQNVTGTISSTIGGEAVTAVSVNGVAVASEDLIDNSDGTLTFTANAVPSATDSSMTSIDVGAETATGKNCVANATRIEGYEIMHRNVRRHWSSQWHVLKTATGSWRLSRSMLFGDIDMYEPANNNSGTQTIHYFAPNTGMWGSVLGETDITSYPPLGSFWEETGMGEFTIPSGSTSAMVDALVANKDGAHLFQAGMWKKHEGFSPGPSGEPLPDIDVNYHKYSTVMEVKKSLGNRKLGEKVMVLLSFNGIAYERFDDDPPFDLNLVKYKGQKPVEVDPWTATATYLVEVAVGEGFVIADTDFEWPKSKRSTVVGDPAVNGVTSTNILKSRFSFEWFHNEEVKLVIEPTTPDWANWLPRGGDESSICSFKATLKGGDVILKGIFHFTLFSSKQSGYCSNAGIQSSDDLKFTEGQDGLIIESEGVASTIDKVNSYEVNIESRDYGANGSLFVTAQINDATWIESKMNAPETRMPFDEDDDNMADCWERSMILSQGFSCSLTIKDLTLDYDSDYAVGSTNSNIHGTRLGDGIIAFDEYRGFMVMVDSALQHQRTNPFIKDLFIRNQPFYHPRREDKLDIIGVNENKIKELGYEPRFIDFGYSNPNERRATPCGNSSEYFIKIEGDYEEPSSYNYWGYTWPGPPPQMPNRTNKIVLYINKLVLENDIFRRNTATHEVGHACYLKHNNDNNNYHKNSDCIMWRDNNPWITPRPPSSDNTEGFCEKCSSEHTMIK